MKKFLIFVVVFVVGLSAHAEFSYMVSGVNMKNFWQKNGKTQQKVLEVGTRILNKNKLDKRVVFEIKSRNNINAYASHNNKTVTVYTGILPYLDSDDELAYLLGHEIAHILDFYEGPGKWLSMKFNSKQYEYKADVIGIDLMVKSGYNPIAAIAASNKIMGEWIFDFGIRKSHPKGSKRLMNMYKYIYKKYPWALNSKMIHNVNYQNFTYSARKDIIRFKQKEKYKKLENGKNNSL